MDNQIYDPQNHLHIPFFHEKIHECKDITNHISTACDQFCGRFLFMKVFKTMFKPSYVNVTQMYEWPLRCFKPPKYGDMRLRNCS